MSKLIVEMPMPVKEWNCLDCKAICADLMRGHYCGITKKTIDTLKNMRARPDWCPIKGVLPDEHGDLIDRDEVKKEIMKRMPRGCMSGSSDREGIVCTRRMMLYPISRAKAVIAAERKDDEQMH